MQNREVEIALADRRKSIVELTMTLLSFTSPATILSVISDVTDRKAADQKVHDYQHQLRSLASQLTLAEHRERQRIVNELHDRIGQTLAFVMLQLGNVQQP